MKKILLAAISIVSFYSCNENPESSGNSEGKDLSEQEQEQEQVLPSLAGTYWEAESVLYGEHHERRMPIGEDDKYELLFTSESEVTLNVTRKYPNREENLTISGTYKYDHPRIVFFGLEFDTKHFLSQLGVFDGYGQPSTITGEDTMVVQMFTGGDILHVIEFRKQ